MIRLAEGEDVNVVDGASYVDRLPRRRPMTVQIRDQDLSHVSQEERIFPSEVSRPEDDLRLSLEGQTLWMCGFHFLDRN